MTDGNNIIHRFGVIDGRTVPELLDEIYEQGKNLAEENVWEERQDSLQTALKNSLTEWYNDDPDKIIRAVDTELTEMVLDHLFDHGIFDADDEPVEEPDIIHNLQRTEGQVDLLLTWLGGAPLVIVHNSPWLMSCRECSPCIPGGGDLDSPELDGSPACCLPPDELPEELRKYVYLNTENNKSLEDEVWTREDIIRPVKWRPVYPGESFEGIHVEPGAIPSMKDRVYRDARIPEMQWHVPASRNEEKE